MDNRQQGLKVTFIVWTAFRVRESQRDRDRDRQGETKSERLQLFIVTVNISLGLAYISQAFNYVSTMF